MKNKLKLIPMVILACGLAACGNNSDSGNVAAEVEGDDSLHLANASGVDDGEATEGETGGTGTATATPPGKCFVRLNTVCKASAALAANRSFLDNIAVSHSDVGRCFQRAQEYKKFCNGKLNKTGLEVSVFYAVDGYIVGGARTHSNGHSYVLHGKALNYANAGFVK